MSNMYKYIGLATIISLMSISAMGQQKLYNGQIIVTPHELSQRGDSLYVNLAFEFNELQVDSRRSLDLIPVIKSKTGQEKALPAVVINGKNRHKAYRRVVKLSGTESGEYMVLRSDKSTRTVNYHLSLPYEEWMKDATLDLKEDMCGCGGEVQQVTMERMVNNVSLEKKIILEPYQVIPHLSYIKPEPEPVKQREQTGEAFLSFAVGKIDIRQEFGNNPYELSKIRTLIEGVKEDKDVKLRKILISGYASPEGALVTNKRLSEGRAKALQNYLMAYYDIPRNIYSVAFGGEDWAGLAELVRKSDMDYKNDILDIIVNNSSDVTRKTKLKSFRAGAPYQYMLREMYPALRRVVCRVDYDVKQFSVEEAKEVIKKRPQNLSMNEMYLVANTYEKASNEFCDVFDTAVRMFPENETANLNAAASALVRKDTVSAEKYLKRVHSKVRIPQYENSMGVLHLLKGDYEKAEQWLKQAEQAGIAEATENLKELNRKRENILLIEGQKK